MIIGIQFVKHVYLSSIQLEKVCVCVCFHCIIRFEKCTTVHINKSGLTHKEKVLTCAHILSFLDRYQRSVSKVTLYRGFSECLNQLKGHSMFERSKVTDYLEVKGH